MSQPVHVLGELTAERFLAEYWQKRPLLVRQAIPGFQGPLTADELAGLACEESAESRIVVQHGKRRWELRHGPFTARDFAELPERRWTLLVQAVDHWVPAVAALLDSFRFIPAWRVDDVMVSYAADQGSVGPHYDQYDVFLLQGQGRRRWRIGGPADARSAHLQGSALRILDAMEATAEWLLEPGDMLYLPPRLAHHGVAEGACLTYSIGFRAPSAAELLTGFAEAASGHLPEELRYADPDQTAQPNPGEIRPEALARAGALLRGALLDEGLLARCFGALVTEPKYDHLPAPPARRADAARLLERVNRGRALCHAGGSRFAIVEAADGPLLFADGAAYPCRGPAADLARALAAQRCLSPDAARAALAGGGPAAQLLVDLYAAGSLTLASG